MEGEKLSFMCDVMRGSKCIVGIHWETDWSRTSKFQDVFIATASDIEQDSPVEVKIGSKPPEKKMPEHWVSVRLDQPLSLVTLQGANFIRFVLQDEGNS